MVKTLFTINGEEVCHAINTFHTTVGVERRLLPCLIMTLCAHFQKLFFKKLMFTGRGHWNMMLCLVMLHNVKKCLLHKHPQ